jgi:hypothetical protein
MEGSIRLTLRLEQGKVLNLAAAVAAAAAAADDDELHTALSHFRNTGDNLYRKFLVFPIVHDATLLRLPRYALSPIVIYFMTSSVSRLFRVECYTY